MNSLVNRVPEVLVQPIAEVLVLAGTAGAGGMAPSTSPVPGSQLG